MLNNDHRQALCIMSMTHPNFGVANLAQNDYQRAALEEAVQAFEQYQMILAKINSYKQIVAHYWNEYDETGNEDFLRTHHTFSVIVDAFEGEPRATQSLDAAWKVTNENMHYEFTKYLKSLL